LKPAAVAEGAGNPITAVRRSDAKTMIQYRYCCNEIDVSKTTLKEAIEKNNYIKHECWINSLYDFYHDSLLSPDKQRYRITRESLLKLLNKTEDTIKQGLRFNDVLPFLFNIS